MTTIKVEKIAAPAAPALAVSQIWKEGDTRFERYVLIEDLTTRAGKAKITTCDKDGKSLYNTSTFSAQKRFNNKRSGYLFVANKAD